MKEGRKEFDFKERNLTYEQTDLWHEEVGIMRLMTFRRKSDIMKNIYDNENVKE